MPPSSLRLAPVALVTAAALTATWLAPTQASAAPAPAAPDAQDYSASAHGDLLTIEQLDVLPAVLPGGGSVATAEVGHSESRTEGADGSTATSSNLESTLLFGSTPVNVDSLEATSPPATGPRQGTLVDVGLGQLGDVGAISGRVSADAANPCVSSVDGRRVNAQSTTAIAGSSLVDGGGVPGLGYLAQVGASEITTTTGLVDVGQHRADVEATTRFTLGDIRLLGGQATVRVSSPVVLQARSDGTKGTAGLLDPPTIRVTAGPETISVPLNGQPVSIPVALPDNPALAANLQVTGFSPTDRSSGARGEAALDELLRVSLDVKLAGNTVAELALGTAPMTASAEAPAGGVDCGQDPADGGNGDSDSDGLSNAQEDDLGTDPHNPDTDGDGLQDGAEVNTHGTDPLDADTDDGGVQDGAEVTAGTDPNDGSDDQPVAGDGDGDGLSDTQEGQLGTDPTKADTDGDGLGDGAEVNTHGNDPTNPDTDGDQLGDGAEVQTHGTDPTNPDTDGDNLTDGAEVHTHGTDPTEPDTDSGGVPDGVEVDASTNPLDPKDDNATPGDADGDGVPTVAEVLIGTEPDDADTDDDALNDGDEIFDYGTTPTDADSDDDGLGDGAEVNKHKTNPVRVDSDDDALGDGDEVRVHGTNPIKADTDDDGLGDGDEVRVHHTKPTVADTDADGLRDGAEVTGLPGTSCRTNPLSQDSDRDRIKDGREYKGFKVKHRLVTSKKRKGHVGFVRTNPCTVDTDGDGLRDGREVRGKRVHQYVVARGGGYLLKRLVSNPMLADSDNDGLTDREEVRGSANKAHGRHRSDPLNYDTDGGHIKDGREVKLGSDPSDAHSAPPRPGSTTGARLG